MAKAFYKILQLREECVKERFLSYRELLREGFDFDLSKYTAVGSGYVNQRDTVESTLEKIYCLLNQCEKPANYSGHSLSVSDLVYIRQGGEGGLYYVDAIGFRKLEDEQKGAAYDGH